MKKSYFIFFDIYEIDSINVNIIKNDNVNW